MGDAQIKEMLNATKVVEDKGGKTVVSGAMIASTQVRQTVTGILRLLDPESYEEYRIMKYSKANEEKRDPNLNERKLAYLFAFKKFMDVTYQVAGF